MPNKRAARAAGHHLPSVGAQLRLNLRPPVTHAVRRWERDSNSLSLFIHRGDIFT